MEQPYKFCRVRLQTLRKCLVLKTENALKLKIAGINTIILPLSHLTLVRAPGQCDMRENVCQPDMRLEHMTYFWLLAAPLIGK